MAQHSPMPAIPADPDPQKSEAAFLAQTLTEVTREEAPVERIYSDPKGIPTMGIGKALATSADGNPPFTLRRKSEIETLIRLGGGGNHSMPQAEYALLRKAVGHLNKNAPGKAKALMPEFRLGVPDSPSSNKFGFILTGPGMESIAFRDIRSFRNTALAEMRKQAAAKGWSPAEIASYEQDLKTSDQMRALTSLYYDGVPSPNAIGHMLDGDAPNAYYEIVYRSNGGGSVSNGIAKRRMREGLAFTEGNEPQTAAEKQEWAKFAAANRARIDAYEKAWPDAFSIGPSFDLMSDPPAPGAPRPDPNALTPNAQTPNTPTPSSQTPNAASPIQFDPANPGDPNEAQPDQNAPDQLQPGARGEAPLAPEEQAVADRMAADLAAPGGAPEALFKAGIDLTQAEVSDLMGSDAYWNSRHPDHLAAQEQVAGWFTQLYGNEPVERDASGRMLPPQPRFEPPSESRPPGPPTASPWTRRSPSFCPPPPVTPAAFRARAWRSCRKG